MDSRKFKLLSFYFLLFILTANLVKAQPNLSNELNLNVSVYDKNEGSIIKNLDISNFKVFVGKTEQKIKSVVQEDEPLSIGILIDLSESMNDAKLGKNSQINLITSGLTQFIKQSNLANEYFIIGFDDKTKVILENTQNRADVLKSLNELSEIKLKNNTAFYDALSKGIEKISNSEHKKRVLLMISDGYEVSSAKRFEDITKTLQKNDVSVYFVTLVSSNDYLTNQQIGKIDRLCEISGTLNFVPEKEEHINLALSYLAEVLKNQYKITFHLERDSKEREWNEVKVKLVGDKSLKKATIKAREGFYFEK